jgi:hypothetical protein
VPVPESLDIEVAAPRRWEQNLRLDTRRERIQGFKDASP